VTAVSSVSCCAVAFFSLDSGIVIMETSLWVSDLSVKTFVSFVARESMFWVCCLFACVVHSCLIVWADASVRCHHTYSVACLSSRRSFEPLSRQGRGPPTGLRAKNLMAL